MLGSIWHEESNRRQRVTRLFLLLGWQFWKRAVRSSVVVTLFNGLKFRAYPVCYASSAVMYARIPDSRGILYLRAHIHEGTLIDIGANVGLVTLLLADQVQHALLFEPNPIAAERAQENLALNHLKFEVHESALSDRTGTVEFEDEGGVSTLQSHGFRIFNFTPHSQSCLYDTRRLSCSTSAQISDQRGEDRCRGS